MKVLYINNEIYFIICIIQKYYYTKASLFLLCFIKDIKLEMKFFIHYQLKHGSEDDMKKIYDLRNMSYGMVRPIVYKTRKVSLLTISCYLT